MNTSAIAFMLLTMGGVLGLNVLCILLWLRPNARKPPAAPPPDDAAATEAPAKPAEP
jgi:hypothetical protein